jgi:ABC-type sugar transport system ATPase subunit
VLTARGLVVGDRVGPLDLEVRRGEVFGLGGLQGQGQREVLMALAGALPRRAGEVTVGGAPYHPRNPRHAHSSGVGYVPEDRQREGLFLRHTVASNMTAASVPSFARWGLLDGRRERRGASSVAERVGVAQGRLPSVVSALSGGNQQKVVLAKALLTRPRVLLLHDCTRGVDVGTKADIFALIADLAAAGTSIVFYSSDLSELAHVCHRVLVMAEGRSRGVIDLPDLSEAEILRLSLSGVPEVAR